MANYTIHCLECGECMEWHLSPEGIKQQAECPTCYTTSKRVFKSPIAFQMNSYLKNTIANGIQIQLMKQVELSKAPIVKVSRRRHRHLRPWQSDNYKL